MSDRSSFSATAPDQLGNVRLFLTGNKTVVKSAGDTSVEYQVDLPPKRIFVFDVDIELESDGTNNTTPWYTFNSSGYLLSEWGAQILDNQLGLYHFASHSDDIAREMTTTFRYVIYEVDLAT